MTIAVADVAKWGKFNLPSDEDELALLQRVLAAVVSYVDKFYATDDPYSDDQEQAILMQSVRIWKRRDTPEGLANFGEFATTVRALDPDVERFLTPRWGFA